MNQSFDLVCYESIEIATKSEKKKKKKKKEKPSFSSGKFRLGTWQ